MPKEQIRKRGKRKPKTEDDVAPASVPAPEPVQEAEPETHGGIHPSRLAFLKTGQRPAPPPRPEGEEVEEDGAADWTRGPRHESEYPFGVLDPDVKAYFRNVEDQIKDWEGVGSVGEEREDRQLFLSSVLSELRGHELQVSTDPDVAVVFERLLPSLNDWGRRVVGDAVGGEWESLVRHRFGSHVAQTWLTLAAGTLDREARGMYPPQHIKQQKDKEADEGVLPTMAELVTTIVGCLQPTLPGLLTQAHASPPVRLLLLVLTPDRALPSLDASEGGADLVRSKRSGKWRKGHGVQGKSILGDEPSTAEKRAVPESVVALRPQIREGLMERIAPVEWQGMGVSPVGSPAVQLLLQCEVEDGAVAQGSLFDILTEGLVTAVESKKESKKEGKKEKITPQPYLSAQVVSQTGTRLLEALLTLAPKRVFKALWKTYFVGKLGKLAAHPYANYAVAAGIGRLDASGVKVAISEIQGTSGGRGLVKTGRTAALLALARRASTLPDTIPAVEGLVVSALDLGDDTKQLVPCMLAMKTRPVYAALLAGEEAPESEDEVEKDDDAEALAAAKARRSAWENRRERRGGKLDPSLPGCLVLQALVALPSTLTLDSLLAQNPDILLGYASSPVASHLLDKVLTVPAVPAKYRRKLIMTFMGQYELLAQDRLGSRVADTVWATADGFMREKIAKSLIPHATALGNSQYGRFFARKLDLHLLQRRPDEWRESVLGVRHHFAHQKDELAPLPEPEVEATETAEERKKRRKEKKRERDEIDDVFAAVEKKRKRKSK
ncbi:uncharacterized protein CcaverHIS019_0402850 [Cutaneotrichosporon cavernicola]|uniref:Nucleolar protein 9 n=1 Tax=Cutaneotrichosporon cavernicola TaxID=279322 RepID=A0AA48L3V5_9TREE|nr:uncharacterized protein CcaverHIS019_0402850 [Cutaneotrichosporon cavernicola]BEI91465.1 hypothetical protein CcaverHIS019_0402850 [Cutaneotrichosporon cavernicola]BEI99240.1 hypothetical protein CcaverHIS631_0402830 [Cutaneotrichosporon cavernicola]BEJ07018.1 hypothetical protein CcaverHIS641_0402870 [Cutaneotrichosporon cavernicola]